MVLMDKLSISVGDSNEALDEVGDDTLGRLDTTKGENSDDTD